MSILNFASNKFFDDDDYALSAVAQGSPGLVPLALSSLMDSDNVNPNLFPLNVDLIEVGAARLTHA